MATWYDEGKYIYDGNKGSVFIGKSLDQEDEKFWVVSGNSHIVSYNWNDSPIDNEFFNFGNCFKTKEEAEAMAKKIKKLLMKGK